ncbi:MAG: hypothetical protein DSZ05_01645 [Sulfurospirillum sp.]|nr:MAG: hypothetical protein DSZ05_01645 [Sulfurospirillum sp.]
MKQLLLSFWIIASFWGCGSSSSPDTPQKQSDTEISGTKQDTPSPSQQPDTSFHEPVLTPDGVKDSLDQVKHDAENIVPIDETQTTEVVTQPVVEAPKEHSVTVYIHGYDDKGTGYTNTYGYDAYDPMLNRLVALTGFDTLQTYDPSDFTDVITITPYYGQKAPDYYTQKDRDEIKAVTDQYGGGIPRYALIVAKYARHVMEKTGAEHINFISASMGSLIARWIIEKDVEHLASQKKILRWKSLEGVIRGNKLASNSSLVKYADSIQKQPIDVAQMSYQWIEHNLHRPRSEAASSYYKDITLSEVTSTKPGDPFDWLMLTTPNDGYQAVSDTYFASVLPQARHNGMMPVHTFFHQTHLGLKKDDGAWANVATFLLPHKRVRITLRSAKVHDIHEYTYFLNKNAEIVFESRVFSPIVAEKWSISDAISERVYDSGALPIHKYRKNGETKTFQQLLYDDYVLKDETALKLTMAAYEVDWSLKYGIHEPGSRDSMGRATITLPLANGTYRIEAEDWSGTIDVEVLEN